MRRSRSPRRRLEPTEETFSISSLSDVSGGEFERRDYSKRYKFEDSRSRHRDRKDSHQSDNRKEYLQGDRNMSNFQSNTDMFSDPSIFDYQLTPSYRPTSPGSNTNGPIIERRVIEKDDRMYKDREYKRPISDRHGWESKVQKEHGDKISYVERTEYKDRRYNDERSGREKSRDERIHKVKSLNRNDKKTVDVESSKSDDRIDRLEKMVELLVNNKSQPSTNFVQPQESNVEVNGKHINISISLWLNKINEYCLERNYDETTCIKYVHTQMSGLMKAWFKTLNVFQYTWPELKLLITKTFPDTFDFASTLRLLVNRIKQPDETITEYYFAKMYLIEYCKISGANAVSCLIDGLNDPFIQNQAREFNFLTPESLYSQFLVNLPNYGLSELLPVPIPEPQIEREYSEIDVVYNTPKVTERVKPPKDVINKKCFTCGKFGHIAEVCRHAPICYHCRQRGHIAAKCPNT